MSGKTNTELWWGTEFNLGIGNSKIRSNMRKSEISLYSKGRRGENEINCIDLSCQWEVTANFILCSTWLIAASPAKRLSFLFKIGFNVTLILFLFKA